MASEIRIRNRLTGGDGSPGGTGNAGNLAVNFDAAAKGVNGGVPKLFASDGATWQLLNKPASVTVGVQTLTSAQPSGVKTGIGPAYAAIGAPPSDPIIIATYGGTAYIKTGAGGADGDWTALGAAAQFASAADIIAGTVTDKAIAPDQLRASELSAPTATPANDVNKLIILGASGKIDSGFIPIATDPAMLAGTEKTTFITPYELQSRIVQTPNATPSNDAKHLVSLMANGKIDSGFLDGIGAGPPVAGNVGKPVILDNTGRVDPALLPVIGTSLKGSHDFTGATAPTPLAKGNIYFNNKTGIIPATGYPGINGQSIKTGDMVLYDGTNFHLIPMEQDLSAYVTKAGQSAMANDAVLTWTPPGAVLTVLDGGDATKSQIENFNLENCVIDCGTF